MVADNPVIDSQESSGGCECELHAAIGSGSAEVFSFQYTMVGCRSVVLCLACSSSLPPKAQNIFLTQCCTRPICPTCLSSNPRLGRYNPCLACLGGVDIVSSSSFVRRTQKDSVNIDGALRDDVMFVLGDDEEEDDGSSPADYAPSTEPPPSYTAASTKPSLSHPSNSSPVTPSGGLLSDQDTNAIVSEDVVPSIYHLSRGDTLQGIALRFGVNVSTHEEP